MRNRNLAAFLGAVAALGGLVIVAGWVFGIEEFIRPAANFGRVKPTVGISFVIAGLQLVLTCFRRSKRGRDATFFLTVAALFQFVVMGSQLLTILSGSPSVLELIIDAPGDNPVFAPTVAPVSLGTILLFFGIASIGLIDNFDGKILLRRVIDKLMLLVPVSALAGYAASLPILYFSLPGISNRMPIYTAILGLACGISIWFSSPRLPGHILPLSILPRGKEVEKWTN